MNTSELFFSIVIMVAAIVAAVLLIVGDETSAEEQDIVQLDVDSSAVAYESISGTLNKSSETIINDTQDVVLERICSDEVC